MLLTTLPRMVKAAADAIDFISPFTPFLPPLLQSPPAAF
jgi:hypothetical protein